MSKEYGEGFQQPTDFFTGKPIPGAPLMGSPSTTRSGNGIVILKDAPESNEPGNSSPTGPTRPDY